MYTAHVIAHADALRAIEATRQELEKRGAGAAVAVADAHGELLAFLRTDGCPYQSITIALNKAFTASRERSESRTVGQRSREEGFPMTNFGDSRFTGWGGGIPVIYDGTVIGAVAVSGLTEDEDEAIARIGVKAILEG